MNEKPKKCWKCLVEGGEEVGDFQEKGGTVWSDCPICCGTGYATEAAK